MSDLVTIEHDAYGIEGVVKLTMNRPEAFNALSENMLDALERAIDEIAHSQARVVVLAAAGKAFCAGHDLKEMRAEPALDYYRDLFARVQGIATAAGCQLVAMCDLAVASSDARFAVSGVNLGLFCATPSVPLTRNVSRKAAFEMLVTGDFIDAQTACERGLVNRVASPEELDDTVRTLAASIASKPRAAVAAGKRLFYRQIETGIEAAYALASESMACNMMDDDTLEGTQAFIEKRKPRWD